MKIKRSWFAFLLLIASYSCQQNITLDLPKYEPKVAVYCILVPGGWPHMYLNISKSYYTYGDTAGAFQFVKTARVIVTDQTANIKDTFVLDSSLGALKVWSYDGHYPITAGHHYMANINYNGQTITAETTVPLPVKVDHFDYVLEPNGYGAHEYHIYFYDLSGQQNYYSLSESDSGCCRKSTYKEAGYVSDLGLDGKLLEITTNDLTSTGGSWTPPFTNGFTINNNSKEIGKYFTDVIAQKNTYQDPFSQPVVIESNVNGGLGIFGGITPSPIFYIHVK